MFRTARATLTCLALAGALLSNNASALIIASTDFDDRTVSGNTASNLNWVLNGVADPGSISADFPLFDTSDAQDRFAVDRNLHNEGNWTADVALNVLGGANIALTNVTLNAFIFNNSGALQGVPRNLVLQASLSDAGGVLDSVSSGSLWPNNNGALTPAQGQLVSFDFTGNTLLAGTSYTLSIIASGEGQGNNAGIDNLAINGEQVPVPATVLLLGIGLLGLRRFAHR